MFAEKHSSLSSYAHVDSLLWTIRGGHARGYPVAYPGEGPGGPASLTFEKTERPEGPKKKFGDRSPSPLFKVLDDRAPPLSQGLDPALLLIHNTMVTMDYVHVI